MKLITYDNQKYWITSQKEFTTAIRPGEMEGVVKILHINSIGEITVMKKRMQWLYEAIKNGKQFA